MADFRRNAGPSADGYVSAGRFAKGPSDWVRLLQDCWVDSERRDRIHDELEWIDARGGDKWRATYVIPFYLNWMSLGAANEEALRQVRELQTRASELGNDDLTAMVQMQWRVQVVGTWFAIARNDPALSDAVHRGFERCHGTLTAPGFTVAVLTYPNSTTADVLQRYRERSQTAHYGDDDFIDAALRYLGAVDPLRVSSEADEQLAQLLRVRDQVRGSA